MNEELRRRCKQVATEVGRKLLDTDRVQSIVAAEPTGSAGVLWDDFSLGSGYAGTARSLLLLGQLLGNVEMTQGAFDHLRRAVRNYNTRPGELGLFNGASGILKSISACSKVEPRFKPSARKLQDRLHDQLLSIDWTFTLQEPVHPTEVDLISGASGVIVALLSSDLRDDQSLVAVDHLAHYLAWIVAADGPTAFYQEPTSYPPGAANRTLHPDGLVDATSAHGIAGVLQALAMTQATPQSQLDIGESITTLAEAIAIDGKGVESYERNERGSIAPVMSSSPVWCRGDTGIAIALSWAAEALGDCSLATQARSLRLSSAYGAVTSPIESSCLCHGKAGILIASLQDADATDLCALLAEQLLDDFDSSTPFGYVESSSSGPLNDPTLLSGAAGVAATLALVASNIAEPPTFLAGMFDTPKKWESLEA